ncbi:SH3 domain-containing protein [Maridesulfovibrio sp.]|uniref:SH3 domain-containing protein n=1 Tax=Maridesulfovibrio sp. TaxID=2795000 RepID=UPI0039F0C9BC
MSLRLVGNLIVSFIVCLIVTACVPKKTNQTAVVETIRKQETVIIAPVVTGTALMRSNVREVSSSEADIVDIIPKNMQVELIGKNGNWYRIKRMNGAGRPGFVYHKLINLDFGNYLGTQGCNKEKTVVFESPNDKSPTVRVIQPQTKFDIIGIENGFYHIRGADFEGYAYTKVCVADPLSPIAKTETKILTTQVSGTPAEQKIAAAKIEKKKIQPRFNTTTKKNTVKKRSSGDNQAAMAIFGAFAQALLTGGGGQQNMTQPHKTTNDNIIDILKTLDNSKELAKKTVEIREDMLSALNETRALQSLVGATVSAMNQNYKAAIDTAQGVSSTGMKKISIKAFIKDLAYEPTDSIEGAAVKIAENGRALKTLETSIKSEADNFANLNSQQIQNLDSIISSFSTNLHASNALYDMSMNKSANIILSIDRALGAYAEKGRQMNEEVTKQLTIIGLSIAELVTQISNAQNNPVGAIAAIPRLIDTMDQFETMQTLFNDFEKDFNYIEENSVLIAKQGKNIAGTIMTARRKNTQVTTMLESYYRQKMELSSRLKEKLVHQAADGFKQVEEKAASVALAEDMLD